MPNRGDHDLLRHIRDLESRLGPDDGWDGVARELPRPQTVRVAEIERATDDTLDLTFDSPRDAQRRALGLGQWLRTDDEAPEDFGHRLSIPLGKAALHLGAPPPLEALRAAVAHFGRRGDLAREARAWTTIGSCLLHQGRMAQAVDDLVRAVDRADRGDDPLARAEALGAHATALHFRGHHAEALDALDRAIEISRFREDSSEHIRAVGHRGVLAATSGEVSTALEDLERAAALARSVGFRFLEIQFGANRAIFAYSRGEYRDVIRTQTPLREASRQLGLLRFYRITTASLASAERALGSSEQAVEYFRESVELARTMQDPRGECLQLGNLGETLHDLGRHAEAAETLEQAVRSSRRLGQGDVLAANLGHLGRHALDQRRFASARRCFEEALDTHTSTWGGYPAAYCWLDLGRCCLEIGDPERARDALARALAIARAAENEYLLGEATGLLGREARQRGDIESALELLGEAFDRANRSSNLEARATWSRAYGELLEECGDPRSCDVYECAAEAVDVLSSLRREERHRRSADARHAEAGSGAVRATFALDRSDTRLERTFEAMERARARTFVDLIHTVRSRHASSARELYALSCQSLCGAERQYRRMERDGASDLKPQRRRVREAEQEVERYLDELRREEPSDQSLHRMRSSSWDEFQGSCTRTGRAWLMYWSTPSELIALVARGNGSIEGRAIGLPASHLANLVHACRPPSSSGRGEESPIIRTVDVDALRHARERLIDPVAPWLDDHEELIVIPHGEMHGLCFAALFAPERFPRGISIGPSATALAARGPLSLPSDPEIGIFTDPRTAAPRLPGARHEAERLAQRFAKSRTVGGAAATREAFERLAAEVDILHFAGHGHFDPERPMRSGLRIAGTEPEGDVITVHDLYGLDLRAPLVVLGACVTGRHAIESDDDWIGLSRGFFHAGARALIAAQWEVDDIAASFLTDALYREILAGNSPPQALRSAQRAVRATTRDAALTRVAATLARTETPEEVASLQAERARITVDPHPYADPFYWAGWVAIGGA
ncbi:MAG: CHAT domain-containing protein [Planctomycetes bacterium]|nr:CHAT domain-containing protein [Planctomycetota bacterium]